MKLKYSLLFLFSFCLMMMNSQKANGQAALLVLIFGDKVASEKFHLSIDGGLNYSSMPGIDNQKAKFTPYFGLGTFIKLNDKWAITPEFKPLSSRSVKGVKPYSDYSTTLTNIEYTLTAGYIDVPVLFQYKITPKLFVSAGGQVSFLISSKQTAEGKPSTGGGDVTIVEDDISLFNKQYYSVPFELGYSLSTQRGGKGIDIKVRYNWGVSEMMSDASYGSTNGSTFQFFLSFPFINIPDASQPKN